MTDIWAKSWMFSHPNFGQMGICQAGVRHQCWTFGAVVGSSGFDICALYLDGDLLFEPCHCLFATVQALYQRTAGKHAAVSSVEYIASVSYAVL